VATTNAPHLDDAPPYPRIELRDLFRLAERPDEIPWQPFKDGVDIHRLYGDGIAGPTAVLLRFSKAGKVPLHEHCGYEHILILAGAQRDQNSTATAGTLMINPPGTRHSVISEAGCIVLAIYHEVVEFLEDARGDFTGGSDHGPSPRA
jgi:anti-sigma factor ChrR (cupin superfamily)